MALTSGPGWPRGQDVGPRDSDTERGGRLAWAPASCWASLAGWACAREGERSRGRPGLLLPLGPRRRKRGERWEASAKALGWWEERSFSLPFLFLCFQSYFVNQIRISFEFWQRPLTTKTHMQQHDECTTCC